MTEWELNILQTTKGPFLDRLEKKTVGEITPSKVGNNYATEHKVITINRVNSEKFQNFHF